MLRTPLLLVAATALTLPAFTQTPIRITADLTEAPRKLYHAEIDLPVKAGPATFITPEWIPGNHRPTGPVSDITGVVFSVDGKPIYWRRDDQNLYEYHVEVPKGVTILHAHLDCIVTSRARRQDRRPRVGEAHALSRQHPGPRHRDSASVTVPAGWGSAPRSHPPVPTIPTPRLAAPLNSQPTTVEQLEDSPRHRRRVLPRVRPRSRDQPQALHRRSLRRA